MNFQEKPKSRKFLTFLTVEEPWTPLNPKTVLHSELLTGNENKM